MSKSIKPVPGVPKPLTKEEQAQRMAAYLAQKKEQLFQGCLFSLISNPNYYPATEGKDLIDKANAFADAVIRKMYLEQKEGE